MGISVVRVCALQRIRQVYRSEFRADACDGGAQEGEAKRFQTSPFWFSRRRRQPKNETPKNEMQ